MENMDQKKWKRWVKKWEIWVKTYKKWGKNYKMLERMLRLIKRTIKSYIKIGSHFKKMNKNFESLQTQVKQNSAGLMDNEIAIMDLQQQMILSQDYNHHNNIRLKGIPDLGSKEKELPELTLACLKKTAPKIDWTMLVQDVEDSPIIFSILIIFIFKLLGMG